MYILSSWIPRALDNKLKQKEPFVVEGTIRYG